MARKSAERMHPAEPSQRQLRVGERIRHALANILVRGEVHDDTLSRYVITIPEVRMTPDLRLANVYVMPLGGAGAEAVIDALNRNKKFIRANVAKDVNLKFAPDLRFHYDETFDEVSRIDAIMRTDKVRRDIDADQDD